MNLSKKGVVIINIFVLIFSIVALLSLYQKGLANVYPKFLPKENESDLKEVLGEKTIEFYFVKEYNWYPADSENDYLNFIYKFEFKDGVKTINRIDDKNKIDKFKKMYLEQEANRLRMTNTLDTQEIDYREISFSPESYKGFAQSPHGHKLYWDSDVNNLGGILIQDKLGERKEIVKGLNATIKKGLDYDLTPTAFGEVFWVDDEFIILEAGSQAEYYYKNERCEQSKNLLEKIADFHNDNTVVCAHAAEFVDKVYTEDDEPIYLNAIYIFNKNTSKWAFLTSGSKVSF